MGSPAGPTSCWSRSLGQHGGARPVLSLDHRRFAQRCGMVEEHAEEEATSACQPVECTGRPGGGGVGRAGHAGHRHHVRPRGQPLAGSGLCHGVPLRSRRRRLVPQLAHPPRPGQARGCLVARPCCVSLLCPPPPRRRASLRPRELGPLAGLRRADTDGLASGENRGLPPSPRLSCLACPSPARVLPLPHLGPGQQWPQCR